MKTLMRKSLGILLVCVMMLSTAMTAYAQEGWVKQSDTGTVYSVTEYADSKEARIIGSIKGTLISSVEVSLVNLGNGKAEIYSNILCHETMRKIKMTLYLEKWNETQREWENEGDFEYEWLYADNPDLSMASVSFNVYGLDRGYKYRARGVFAAYDLDSSLHETSEAATTDVYFD